MDGALAVGCTGQARAGAAVPGWLRWLSRLSLGARIGFDAIRMGDPEPLYVAAPAPPPRDVARLSRRAAALGAIRSWGRFDAATDGRWQHRITVPSHRARSASEIVTRWLALNSIDASLE